MQNARIPVREWSTYDLATVVARDDKKQSRFNATHIEGDAEESAGARARELKDSDSA